VVVGTRPEVIKLAPVVRELRARDGEFVCRLCATAQHRELLDQALRPFGLCPDLDLDLMRPGQTLPDLTARAVTALDGLMQRERPDTVLVQGDTTTAFCAALASYYQHLPIGHVEAGLRTGDKYAPFPEEANRAFISQIADYHFAPTDRARSALLENGVRPSAIFVTGNTVVDALHFIQARNSIHPPPLPPGLSECIAGAPLVLVTGHRRESFGPGFEGICNAIRDTADAFRDVVFVYPVHLNPGVREPVMRILGGHPRIHLLEPLPYDAFVWLMQRATIVLTDSGGVQEEAPALGKPVLVIRETTERPEGIEAGNALLVGVGQDAIVRNLAALLSSPARRAAMGAVASPYGDGQAASRIAQVLQDQLAG
jgi:UDP-N-acetylglucosamine 2-epimerase (non-hydrolysing)